MGYGLAWTGKKATKSLLVKMKLFRILNPLKILTMLMIVYDISSCHICCSFAKSYVYNLITTSISIIHQL